MEGSHHGHPSPWLSLVAGKRKQLCGRILPTLLRPQRLQEFVRRQSSWLAKPSRASTEWLLLSTQSSRGNPRILLRQTHTCTRAHTRVHIHTRTHARARAHTHTLTLSLATQLTYDECALANDVDDLHSEIHTL